MRFLRNDLSDGIGLNSDITHKISWYSHAVNPINKINTSPITSIYSARFKIMVGSVEMDET